MLGGGTGGTLAANRLLRALADDPDGVVITVVDRDDDHLYQPGLLFVPFGLSARPQDLVRSRPAQLHEGIAYRTADIERVDLDAQHVLLSGGVTLVYDVLVVASGARLVPEETEGLTGPGYRETVHNFYDLDGAVALERALSGFTGGRLVVNVVDMPIKCPVAPLEFCFLADWYFTERGIRDQVELIYVTPLDAAFTKPVAAATLSGLLAEKHVELVTEFNTGEVDGHADAGGGKLVSYDGREVPFDLAVVVPLHGGAAYVDRSPGLGDEFGFVPTDPHTLQSTVRPNVFVIGDAAAVPTSKAVRSPISRARPSRATWCASWPGRRWTPLSTGTRTASSRAVSTRPCSSTSTTTPSRCRATTPPGSACRCSPSRDSTTSAS